MEYCIEFEKKRIQRETPKAIVILSTTYGGVFTSLPKSQITVEDFDEDKPGPMVRVVLPEWLYDKNRSTLIKITRVTIEKWHPSGKVEPIQSPE